MSENARFTAKQMAFIDWLANGKYDRSPPTQGALATELGVSEKTLYRWKQGNHKYTRDDFHEAVIKRARELNGEAIPDTYSSLRTEAIKGSYQHQRLLLELTGEIGTPDGSEDKPYVVKVIKGVSTDDI